MNSEGAIIDDVRRRATEISERYGHDLKAYAAHLKDIENQNSTRTVGQFRVVRENQKAVVK